MLRLYVIRYCIQYNNYNDKTLHSRTTPHTSPLRARYGVSFVSYTKNNYRDISRAHCTLNSRANYVVSIVSDLGKHERVMAAPYCSLKLRNVVPTCNAIKTGRETDMTWRRNHQMKAFQRCWSFVRGIYRLRMNSPHKGPVMRTLMFRWCGSA